MKQIPNGRMTICVEQTEFSGKPYIDIRTYYTNGDGELKPTKKGTMIPLDLSSEVAEAILAELSDKPKKKAAPVAKAAPQRPETKVANKPIYFVCVNAEAKAAPNIPFNLVYHSLSDLVAVPRAFSARTVAHILKTTQYRKLGSQVKIGKTTIAAVWNNKLGKWQKPA